MSKSELNKTLDTKIEKQQQQNGNTFRRFPFRSQSLRLSKKSKSSSNNNKQSQQFNSSEDGNHPRKFLRQQTVNGRLSSTTSLNNLILSKLLLKDRDLIIISSSSNGNQNLSSSSSNETYNKQSSTPTTFFKRLSRHQSIKSIQQQQPQQKNRSNSISQNASSLNFLVGNFPPPPTLSKTTTANHHYDDDEGVVTFEESEDDDDDDEDYHPDDNDDGRLEIKYQIPGRYPRLVRLVRDCHQQQQQRLGIQIIGGCDFGIPVIIVGLRQNSPAQNCGKIFIGDQILSVNDVPINENNTHNDTLRLLAECGPIVSLLLKHTKSVMNFDRKWKHLQQNFDKILLSNNHDEKNTDDLDLEAITTIKHRQMSLTLKDDHHLNSSVENFDHNDDDDNHNRYRINLLASTISRFVSFSDRIRDSGFEIFSPTTTTTTSNNGSIIIECLNEDICRKWFSLIKNTIENLQENFVSLLTSMFLFFKPEKI